MRENNDTITRRLGNERIAPLLMYYAIPAVIGTMVNALYNIVDRIFIGQGVGAMAISGLTLTFPILILLQGFGMLIGAGASTRVSIFLGRKENDRAELVLGNALTLSVIMCVVTIVPSMLYLDDLLRWFGGSEQTIPYAKEYLYIVIPGNVFAHLSFGFNGVMRASGYPKKAMSLMMLGALLNILLDPIFIFWLDMGIRGAAIATVISMAICATLVMSHFSSRSSLIHFRTKNLKLHKAIVLSIVAIGVSPFTMQIASSLVNVVFNHSLYYYGGDLAIGANGIITSVGMLLVMLNIGIAQGMQPIVGFNYGAGNHRRVMETLRLVIITATLITSVGCTVSLLFPEVITRAFTNDAELIGITTNGMRISLCAFFVVGSQIVITQFFQSIGFAGTAMFLSLSRQVLFLIPAILLFPYLFELDGVWLASPFSDGIAALTGWLFLWRYVKRLKRQP
ncbi:MATE family efflux transporter [Parabacteroides sp. OttesenSCG-928-N08]|nr:MATE family efflux transporter [Parabacteroides sp. OttesenSCG-928-N08]